MTGEERRKRQRESMISAAMKQYRRTDEYPRAAIELKGSRGEQPAKTQKHLYPYRMPAEDKALFSAIGAQANPERFAQYIRGQAPSTNIEDLRLAHLGSMKGGGSGGESTARQREAPTEQRKREHLELLRERLNRYTEKRKRRRPSAVGGAT